MMKITLGVIFTVIVWQRNWPDVRIEQCDRLAVLSDNLWKEGGLQKAANLAITLGYALVVPIHDFLIRPPPCWKLGGVLKSTIEVVEAAASCCYCSSQSCAVSLEWRETCSRFHTQDNPTC